MERFLAIASVALVSGCIESTPTRTPMGPAAVDPLYAPFLDGKLDALGHPLGAAVYAVPDECDSGANDCMFALEHTRGMFVANVRASASPCSGLDCDEVAFALVVERDGETVESRTFTRGAFAGASPRNLTLSFTLWEAQPTAVGIHSLSSSVDIEYLEVFRVAEQVLIEPPSGRLPESGLLEADFHTVNADTAEFSIRCNGQDFTGELEAALALGGATVETGQFRAHLEVDVEKVLSTCESPRAILVSARASSGVTTTSKVTYGIPAPACSFADVGSRVLLTGFEPFPADSAGDNSSEAAVEAFDPSSIDEASFMKMVLPVEWATASAMVADVIDRCEPDVVLSFGQGRYTIEVERTGYNLMDTTAMPGGVPDNRGVVELGRRIWPGGPAEVSSTLPVNAIAEALDGTKFGAEVSTDPGRYICNNLFYDTLSRYGEQLRAAGFIHLPIIEQVSDDDRQSLADVVRRAAEQTLNP